MAKDDTLRLGKPTVLSFTGTGKDDFLALSKEKQIKYVSDSISPKGDVDRAKQLLHGVKHSVKDVYLTKPTAKPAETK